MNLVRRLWMVFVMVLVGVAGVGAQGDRPYVAFINSSGQLVVSSGGGEYRWIVTNPGETLNPALGYRWSGDGQLFFAIGGSLRVANPLAKTVSEIGQADGAVSGGVWMPDGSGVVVAVGNQVLLYPADGGGASELANGAGFALPTAAITPAMPIAPDSSAVFVLQNGQNTLLPIGGAATALPGNRADWRNNGLWADNAPLVASWGSTGTSVISVTNAATGETITLDSGRSAPINPLAWRPGTTQLIYRDGSSTVRTADVSCLLTGCSDNPLASGVALLPASAVDVQVDAGYAYFLDGETIGAVNLDCIAADNCAQITIPLGNQAAPQTTFDVGGNTLAYTAYTQDAFNGGDREVRMVDVRCLVSEGGCWAQPVLSGAVAGQVSPDGGYIAVEMVGGALNVLRLFDQQLMYLSDAGRSSLLSGARWE